jgi:hypothetical protein
MRSGRRKVEGPPAAANEHKSKSERRSIARTQNTAAGRELILQKSSRVSDGFWPPPTAQDAGRDASEVDFELNYLPP